MSAPATRPWASMRPRKAGKSTFERWKLIETGTAVSCREIHALNALHRSGFEHHPYRVVKKELDRLIPDCETG